MVNVEPAEVPPAVATVTLAVPAVAIRLAGTVAVIWVGATLVNANAVDPHLAVAVCVKLEPLMVSENVAPPATALEGFRLAIVGGGGLIVNVEPGDVPPVVVTVMLTVPAAPSSVDGTAAVNCVALLNVVASAVLPQFTAAPVA